MKRLQTYNSPEMTVIEMTAIYGVMQNIGEGSTPEDLSRTATPHTDEDDPTGASRSQRNVWDEDEEQ